MENISFYILNSTKQEAVSEWVYTFFGFYLSVIGCIGFFSNATALYIFIRNKHLWNPTNLFIICILSNDFVMCLIGIPLSAIANFYRRFIWGMKVCIFQGFIMFFGSITSLFMFGALSYKRYKLINSQINPAPKESNIRSTQTAILICYLFGLFWSTVPFVGWSVYENEAIGTTCGVRLNSLDKEALSYNICLFICCYCGPVILMLYCYIKLFRKIKEVNNNPGLQRQLKDTQKRMKYETRLLRTIILMVGAFLVSWTPYAIVAFWRAFGFGNLPAVASGIPALAAKTSVILNPFIYTMSNSQFKDTFYKTIQCKCFRPNSTNSTTPRILVNSLSPNHGRKDFNLSESHMRILPSNNNGPDRTESSFV